MTTVLLQAMKSDPPADYKCRDKFLVQSIAITADREATNVQQIWSFVEKAERSAIQEKKIRVVYLQPGEQVNGGAVGEVSTDQFESSPPSYAFSAPDSGLHTTPVGIGPSPRPTSKHDTHAGETSSTHSARSSDDKDAELAAARATIAILEAELKSQSLRLHKTIGVDSDAKERITQGSAGMGMTTHPPEGIPVQICAVLCLAAFFIAWFFF